MSKINRANPSNSHLTAHSWSLYRYFRELSSSFTWDFPYGFLTTTIAALIDGNGVNRRKRHQKPFLALACPFILLGCVFLRRPRSPKGLPRADY